MDFVRAELPVALEAAGAGLKHISRIVLAMKEFSHPGSEGLQPADINRAIETTITIARNEWKYVAQLHTELGTLPTVLCNVSSFNQVMLNLIVNAAQAIGERVRNGEMGNIWIKTQPAAGTRRDPRRGRRPRRPRSDPRPDLRSVLHDEGSRQRHRAGVVDRVPRRVPTARRHAHDGAARRRRRVLRDTPAGRGDRARRQRRRRPSGRACVRAARRGIIARSRSQIGRSAVLPNRC